MTDSSIRIAIEAVDNATNVMRNVSSALTGLNQGMQAIGQIYRTVKRVIDECVGSFVTYANQVRTISQVSGQNAEQVSRLIQVTDDFKVSTESLNTVMRKMAQEGLTLSIDSLADLSDKYLELTPGVERQTFLTQTFGRAGIQFAEIMLAGGDAIREQSAAISDNLILTEEAIRDAREYERQMDDLNDSAEGLKYALGQSLTPVLIDLTQFVNDGIIAWQGMEETLRTTAELTNGRGGLTEALGELPIIFYEGLTWGWVDEALASLEDIRSKTFDVIEVWKDLNDTTAITPGLFSNMIPVLDDYGEAYQAVSEYAQDYTQYVTDLETAQRNVADATAEYYDYLASHPYDTAGLEALKGKVNDAQQAVEDLEAANKRQTDQWMLNILTQQLSIGNLTATEMDFLLQFQVDTGLISESAATRASEIYANALIMAAGFDTAAGSVWGIKAGIDALYDKTVTITINQQVGNIGGGGGGVGIQGTFDDGNFGGNVGGIPAGWVYIGTVNGVGTPAVYEQTGTGARHIGQVGGGWAKGGFAPIGRAWIEVGEEGPEFISPRGEVIPADKTRAMKAAGFYPSKRLASGGDVWSGNAPLPYHVLYAQQMAYAGVPGWGSDEETPVTNPGMTIGGHFAGTGGGHGNRDLMTEIQGLRMDIRTILPRSILDAMQRLISA